MKIAAAAYFRKQRDAGDVFAAYFPAPKHCHWIGLTKGGNLRTRNVFVTAAGFARIYMKIAGAAYFRNQGDAGNVGAAYFPTPKHYHRIGLTKGGNLRIRNVFLTAAGFARIYMKIATSAYFRN